ncbi:hypothetical protein Tco_1425844, partial [Tanacetum coccineum]
MGVTLSGSQGLSSPQANGYVVKAFQIRCWLPGYPKLDGFHLPYSWNEKWLVQEGMALVPAGSVVPTGKDNIIVSAGRTNVIPAGSTILVLVVLLMEILIADHIALDDALVAPADRLKIGKCNLRLSTDVASKEATLQ